jgi:hypothetical protein
MFPVSRDVQGVGTVTNLEREGGWVVDSVIYGPNVLKVPMPVIPIVSYSMNP